MDTSTATKMFGKAALAIVASLILVGVLTVYFDNLLFAGIVVVFIAVAAILYRERFGDRGVDGEGAPPEDQSTLDRYE
jgi:hypothetical protein